MVAYTHFCAQNPFAAHDHDQLPIHTYVQSAWNSVVLLNSKPPTMNTTCAFRKECVVNPDTEHTLADYPSLNSLVLSLQGDRKR